MHRKKSVVLILGLFTLITISSLAYLSTYQYVSFSNLNRRYERELQVFYDLEGARTICLWEMARKENNWDTLPWTHTIDSTPTLKDAYIDGDGFYKIPARNFKAKVYNTIYGIRIYVHAFRGDEANPQYSRYLEYLYTLSPLYKFAIFSNQNIYFEIGRYEYNGGRVHTNGNIYFYPRWEGVRLNRIGELSAKGTIAYGGRYHYPAPSLLDYLDGEKDGMSPAPYFGSNHYYTTTGEAITPGPYRYFWTDGRGWGIDWKWYGKWMGNEWGSYNQVPLPWRGEDTYFYGRQYSGSGYNYDEKATYRMDLNGNAVSGMPKVTVTTFQYDYTSNSLQTFVDSNGLYYGGYVYFRPAINKSGEVNNDWFSLPAALPQEYNWEKYYSVSSLEIPVQFYVTEGCDAGTSGCNVNPGPFNLTRGWRYAKQNAGRMCTDEDCYNSETSTYVKVQDWHRFIGGVNYFSYLNPASDDKNLEFFEDYIYGNDVYDVNSPYRKTKTFNSLKQPSAFSNYLSLLTKSNIEGVINSGVPRKDIDPKVFATGENSFIEKAKEGGLYIPATEYEVDELIEKLNEGLEDNEKIAKKVTFYNWKTNKPVTLIDINIKNFKTHRGLNFNGIIYSKFPIRLSEAQSLPGGASSTDKKAFTLIAEESVYLKGDFNYVRDDPSTENNEEYENWQLSHIVTKKKIYMLSNVFNDPQSPPDFAIYPEYPFVYVKAEPDPNNPGQYIYYKEEADPTEGGGVWVNADAVFNTYPYSGGYRYYPGMDHDTRVWVNNTKNRKQKEHQEAIDSGRLH
ncbi:MAG: hypothetical protein NC904_08815, partial [Candidatus Omnitrophica bacterium]|nr:hypothetical protein [Candidatus Omnitrophota bacterium]